METSRLLIAAMAEKCRAVMQKAPHVARDLPEVLGLTHLRWMCDRIETNAEIWPAARLHRWIGFVQAGAIANRILDIDQLKAMFDEANNAHAQRADDQDLIDHLDAGSGFNMEIGGQG